MTKTISFELSKRLDELGLLRDVETEYIYTKRDIGFGNIDYDIIEGKYFNLDDGDIKALTTDEAIEFLPEGFWLKKIDGRYLFFFYRKCEYRVWEENLINGIENFIKFLLDNNLIGPTNKN